MKDKITNALTREYQKFKADNSAQMRGIFGGGGLSGSLDGALQDRLKNLTNRQEEQAAGSESGEVAWFDENDFEDTGQTLSAGAEIRVFEFTVPAQTGYVWGFGEATAGGKDNQGTIYFDGQDSAGNDISGKLRLRSENAVGKETGDHGKFSTSRLDAPARETPSEWHKLPERNMKSVTEDSRLYVTLEVGNANDSNTLDVANTVFDVALTQFEQGSA
jgi:hypothetical protein